MHSYSVSTQNVWEYQWSNFIYNCMSTFLHYVHCKDALFDCSAPGGERCESLTGWWNFRKISILVKIFEKFRFWSNFRKLRVWSKFPKNFVNFEKFGLGLNFRKFSILFKFSKISILVKISIFSKLSKNIDLGQIFEKFRFWSKLPKNFNFFEKFWFCSNFLKISILVKMNEKFRFFLENVDIGQIFEKFRF